MFNQRFYHTFTMNILTQIPAAGAFFLILFVISASSTPLPVSEDISDSVTCHANKTCPIGDFCSDGQCQECQPCKTYQKRLSPPSIDGISCAKTFAECGACLPGFEEQSLTPGSPMRKCSPIPVSTERPSKNIPESATCDSNTTCPIEYFCKDGFNCEMCALCEKRHRESPPPIDGTSCAKTEAECGPCLPGYQEQSLTGNRKMIECSLISDSTAGPSSTDTPDVTCDSNTTCPHRFYCSDAGQCQECVPCEKNQNRQSPPPIDGISCAKTFAECGTCFDGYEEQNLTRSGEKRKCHLITMVKTSIPPPIDSILIIVLAVVVPFIIVLVFVLCYCFNKQLKKLICCNRGKNNPHSEKQQPNVHSVQNEVELKSFKTKLYDTFKRE